MRGLLISIRLAIINEFQSSLFYVGKMSENEGWKLKVFLDGDGI